MTDPEPVAPILASVLDGWYWYGGRAIPETDAAWIIEELGRRGYVIREAEARSIGTPEPAEVAWHDGGESSPAILHDLLDRWGAPRTHHNPYEGVDEPLNLAGRLTWMLNPKNEEGWDWRARFAAPSSSETPGLREALDRIAHEAEQDGDRERLLTRILNIATAALATPEPEPDPPPDNPMDEYPYVAGVDTRDSER
jgi:hypothetical protein